VLEIERFGCSKGTCSAVLEIHSWRDHLVCRTRYQSHEKQEEDHCWQRMPLILAVDASTLSGYYVCMCSASLS
jgi:hypothetical protein